MIRFYPNEEFREVKIDYPLQKRYAISNKGRLLSFTDSIEAGTILNGGKTNGFRTLRYKIRKKNGKIGDRTIYIYKIVAQLFIPKQSDDQLHVIHLDHALDNDEVKNLKWVTLTEKFEHRKKNPKVINSVFKVQQTKLKSDGRKLTLTKVIHLKKILSDPTRKTRNKMLAKQFGISEMQVSRIKNGQNSA